MSDNLVTITMTRDEASLVRAALDSHRYWQLTDPEYRNDGYGGRYSEATKTYRVSESVENVAEYRQCLSIEARVAEAEGQAGERDRLYAEMAELEPAGPTVCVELAPGGAL
jgi:hypothetical protein